MDYVKRATDELRPSLSPVLHSSNRLVEGRHEGTHSYRHRCEGSVRALQLDDPQIDP